MQDQVGNNSGDWAQWDLVDAEAPDKFVNVLYVLLMGIGSKKSFEWPASISILTYLSNFFKGSNGTPHDGCLLESKENFLDVNGWGIASVNNIYVVFDWNKYTIIIKDRPILLDERIYLMVYFGVQMWQVEIAPQLLTVFCFVVYAEEFGMNLIKRWGWMLS